MSFLNFGKKPKDPAVNPELAKDAKMEQQKKIGQQLREAVDRALSENDVYNKMSDGKISTKTGMPYTDTFPNGDSFVIVIKYPGDENLNGGGIAHQISVNLGKKGEELYIQDGPYGEGAYKSIEEAASFQSLVAEKARNCSKFPQQA
jgi:hypothetical protein